MEVVILAILVSAHKPRDVVDSEGGSAPSMNPLYVVMHMEDNNGDIFTQ